MDQVVLQTKSPGTAATSSGLRLRGISKRYQTGSDALDVLHEIDLDVAPGEIVGIVGRSGCGKSTLLRVIAGLDQAFDGEIDLAGNPVVGPGVERGIVFQEPRLFPWLTIRQNISIATHEAPLSAKEKRRRVDENIELVGLAGFDDHFPHQISGGMSQRVALARALSSEPSLLLLDEPFAALDALTKLQMQDELLRIWRQRSVSMVLITHDIEEAIYLCDRVMVMSPRPGSITKVVRIEQERPRQRHSTELGFVRQELLSELGIEGMTA